MKRAYAPAIALLLACAAPAIAHAATAAPAATVAPASSAPAGQVLAPPAPSLPIGRLEPGSGVGGGAPEVPTWSYLLNLAGVSAVVGVLGYVGLKLFKEQGPRFGLVAPGVKQIRVIERQALDPKRSVFLVSVGKRTWLLAATETSVTPIAELAPEDLALGFADLVQREEASK